VGRIFITLHPIPALELQLSCQYIALVAPNKTLLFFELTSIVAVIDCNREVHCKIVPKSEILGRGRRKDALSVRKFDKSMVSHASKPLQQY
jgi:hypothetical protein